MLNIFHSVEHKITSQEFYLNRIQYQGVLPFVNQTTLFSYDKSIISSLGLFIFSSQKANELAFKLILSIGK